MGGGLQHTNLPAESFGQIHAEESVPVMPSFL